MSKITLALSKINISNEQS